MTNSNEKSKDTIKNGKKLVTPTPYPPTYPPTYLTKVQLVGGTIATSIHRPTGHASALLGRLREMRKHSYYQSATETDWIFAYR